MQLTGIHIFRALFPFSFAQPTFSICASRLKSQRYLVSAEGKDVAKLFFMHACAMEHLIARAHLQQCFCCVAPHSGLLQSECVTDQYLQNSETLTGLFLQV